MKKLRLLQFYVIPILIIIIVGVLLYIKNDFPAIIILIVFLIYLQGNLYIYWRKHNSVNSFTNYINDSIKDEVYNLVFPVAIIDEQGNIVWNNKQFEDIQESNKSTNKILSCVVKGINLEKIINSEKTSHQKLKIGGKFYDVHSVKVEQNDYKSIIIYFNDISSLLTSEDLKENIVLIEVDNLNDVLDGTDENNRPLIAAEIERTINAYANSNNAMIKKYDTNKYILSMQNKYVEMEIENGFCILETISNIQIGNKIEVTISIGIGRGGITPLENSTFATMAIELALGRGGDQVAIKNGDEIKFFGGNSKEVEKRTRVRARVISHALKELIYDCNKVYIVGHQNPDMDCFGAAVALSSIVIQLQKQCNIVINNDTKAIEYYLDKLKSDESYNGRFISISEAKEGLDDDTLVIVVDVHNKSYISGLDIVELAKKKVIIDHHRRSPDMILGALLNYIEVYASSTSEMVSEIIQYMVDEPCTSPLEANGLLAGIFMDTKSFSFKTGVRTFEAATFLKSLGADTIEVKKMFTDNLNNYLLIAETIKSAKVDSESKCAIAVCPNEVSSVIIAKAADELLNISGILVSFVLGKIDNEIYISGRSVGDINVQVVLEALGGGGHMNIAGAKLVNTDIDRALEQLEEKINKYLKVGE